MRTDTRPALLVLDDHDSLRRNIMALLEDEGFPVLGAASGEEALDILQTSAFDVAIVDMRLPGMNGNEFILAAHKIRPALLFVVHTGSSDYQLPEALRLLGMTEDSIFLKPISDIEAFFSHILAISQTTGGSDG